MFGRMIGLVKRASRDKPSQTRCTGERRLLVRDIVLRMLGRRRLRRSTLTERNQSERGERWSCLSLSLGIKQLMSGCGRKNECVVRKTSVWSRLKRALSSML